MQGAISGILDLRDMPSREQAVQQLCDLCDADAANIELAGEAVGPIITMIQPGRPPSAKQVAMSALKRLFQNEAMRRLADKTTAPALLDIIREGALHRRLSASEVLLILKGAGALQKASLEELRFGTTRIKEWTFVCLTLIEPEEFRWDFPYQDLMPQVQEMLCEGSMPSGEESPGKQSFDTAQCPDSRMSCRRPQDHAHPVA